jgi:hypothetical protein
MGCTDESFDLLKKLISSIRAAFEQFRDVHRPGNHQTCTVADAALSAYHPQIVPA